jgi:hypothetical protein
MRIACRIATLAAAQGVLPCRQPKEPFMLKLHRPAHMHRDPSALQGATADTTDRANGRSGAVDHESLLWLILLAIVIVL